MKFIPLGNAGIKVSQMCLGTMMFGDRCEEAEAARIIDAALERDVTFIDTASMYGAGKTEEILGRILKGRRERFFVATKVNRPKGEEYPLHIAQSLEDSLCRLQTDYVDLFLIHWPRAGMNPTAIMKELDKVVRTGKARFVGCCNFPAWLVGHFNAIAASIGTSKLVNNQIPYNLIERGVEVEVLPQAKAEQIAITCYRPLMAGVLSGKYRPGQPIPGDSRATDDERIPQWMANHETGVLKLFEIAERRGVPPSNVAIAWVKDQPGVTCPIVGVSRLSQFIESVKAFDITLSAEEQKELTTAFASEVKEVSQYYGPLRRNFELVAE